MKRIKDAWAVLVGRKRATTLSQGLLDKMSAAAAERGISDEEYVDMVREIGHGTVEYMDQEAAAQEAVVAAAEEVTRNG